MFNFENTLLYYHKTLSLSQIGKPAPDSPTQESPIPDENKDDSIKPTDTKLHNQQNQKNICNKCKN